MATLCQGQRAPIVWNSGLTVTIAVITDSAAALPAERREASGVTVVPLQLEADGRTILDDGTTHGDVTGVRITTSAPSPGAFDAAIRDRFDAGADGVVVLTVAGSMSATHNAATVAAAGFGARCRVVDTQTAAGGQGLVVLAAAGAARVGGDLDQVARRAERVADRIRLVAMVPRLEHLVLSGRIPAIVARAGDAVGVHPLFEFRAGSVLRMRPALSADAALERIFVRFSHSRVAGARARVAVLHASAPDRAAGLRARVESDDHLAEVFVGAFGAVMEAHTGPGLVGMAWWWDPDGSEVT
jgi:DegV family protein with EDD domain